MFPPVPSPNSAPPPDSGAVSQGVDPGVLLEGITPGVNQNSGLPKTPEEKVQGFMLQVKQIQELIDALGGDFPEAAEDLRQAKQMLTNSLSKVAAAISGQGQQFAPPQA